jgi:cytochrome c oxidase cbb3-type subunit 4
MSLANVDINLLRGAVLILLILAFLGIWAWAWSKHRKPAFREMSMLPLEEDVGQARQIHGDNDGNNDSKTEGTKE